MKEGGPGMAYFNKEHWQKNVSDVNVGPCKYTKDNFGQLGDYKQSADALNSYVKTHKPKK